MSLVYAKPDVMDYSENPSIQPQLILLAHGSRDDSWCLTFKEGLQTINHKLDNKAQLAYMEMAEPGLDTVITRAYQAGIRNFQIIPLFFAAGRHLLHDIPVMIEKLHEKFPDAVINLQNAVGQREPFWHILGEFLASEYKTKNSACTDE